MKKFKSLIKKIREINRKPVMGILPGQLAFFFILSIPPLVLLVGIIANALSVSTSGFTALINNSFPASTSSLIIPIVSGRGLSLSVILFIVGALITVSNGTNAVILTSNVIYNVDNHNAIKHRIKAMFLVLLLVFLLAFIIVVPAFGGLIISALKEINAFGNIIDQLMFLYNIIKFPLSFIVIYFIIKIIYTISPDMVIKSREVTAGALFTTVLWIVATEVYSYYVTTFAQYDVFYGNIANLIILLLWIYLLSYIFVLGMALNASAHSIGKQNN